MTNRNTPDVEDIATAAQVCEILADQRGHRAIDPEEQETLRQAGVILRAVAHVEDNR